MSESPQLEYAPRHAIRWFQRRGFHRFLWISLIIVVLPLIIWAGLLIWEKATSAIKTSRNLAIVDSGKAYQAPNDQVVFDMNAGVVNTVVCAPPWKQWFPPMANYPTVFLHALRDHNPVHGLPEQLVGVQLETQLRNAYDGRTILDKPLLCFNSYTVANVSSSRYVSGVSGSTHLVILPQPADAIRIFAGQVSPNDSSRFTFDVEYNGVRQTVDGQFDRNVLLLKPRGGVVERPFAWRHAEFWCPAGSTESQQVTTRAVAQSDGVPSPTMWPPTPFGKPFTISTTLPATMNNR